MKNRRILTYRVDRETAEVISERYGNSYEILDVSDCFMDLIVLTAAARIADPDELYDEDVELLTEVFQWDPDDVITFTCSPSYPEKLAKITWKTFKHSKKEKSQMAGIRKYSKSELRGILEKNHRDFYREPVLNYSGISMEGEFYTEIAAGWLLEKTGEDIKELLLAGSEILPEKEYAPGPIHKKEDISFNDSGRDEENIAKKLMKQGSAGQFTVVDYQVPVNRAMGSHNGKVDIILSQGRDILLGELKDADSRESFLRAVVEIRTYYEKIMGSDMLYSRFLRDYSPETGEEPAHIVPAVILFEGTRPFSEYDDGQRPAVKMLAERLGVRLIKISPGETRGSEIENTEYNLSAMETNRPI